ncbi:hypothetical protein OS493_039519, partial [Desmophyllum pertusum]
ASSNKTTYDSLIVMSCFKFFVVVCFITFVFIGTERTKTVKGSARAATGPEKTAATMVCKDHYQLPESEELKKKLAYLNTMDKRSLLSMLEKRLKLKNED